MPAIPPLTVSPTDLVFFVLLVPTPLVPACVLLLRDLWIRRRGVRVTATVRDAGAASYRPVSPSGVGPPLTRYRPTVSFGAGADRTEVVVRSRFAVRRPPAVGSRVEIVYLPGSPRAFRFVADRTYALGEAFTLLFLAALGCLALLLVLLGAAR